MRRRWFPAHRRLPTIPEISLARKNNEQAAAKMAIFAYHRETRRPVWQSGVAQARSRAKDTWIFGAGPFQTGTIHDGTEFVDGELPIPLLTADHDDVTGRADPLATYSREATYLPPQWDGWEQAAGGEAGEFRRSTAGDSGSSGSRRAGRHRAGTGRGGAGAGPAGPAGPTPPPAAAPASGPQEPK